MKGRFPIFKLSERQIQGIANIVRHEQGSIAGMYAEASQIANLAELRYGSDPVKCVTSGWYAKGRSRYNAGTHDVVACDIVRKVLCHGLRTLPRYIDEHDCMSDIATAKNGNTNVKGNKKKWIRHETVIRNKMSSKYIFYDFPGGVSSGVDPFGYTSKTNREKYGDFCYTLDEARSGLGRLEDYMPTLKKGTKGKAVEIWQKILGIEETGSFGNKTLEATKEFQKQHKLTVDGIVGAFTWSAGLGTL